MRPPRGLVELQRSLEVPRRWRLGRVRRGKCGGEGEGERVRVVDGEGAARGKGTAVCVCRVADQRDAAVAKDPGRQRGGAKVVRVVADVGRDVCEGLDDGVPTLRDETRGQLNSIRFQFASGLL